MEDELSGAAHSVVRDIAREDDHRIEGAEDELDGMEEEEMERAFREAYQEQCNPAPMPRLRKKGNTGPKGVLADYAEAKERTRLKREAQILSFNLEMKQKGAVSYQRALTEEERDLRRDQEEEERERNGETARAEDDEEFMRQYREQRLRELKGGVLPEKKKIFGYLRRIPRDEFPDEIDDEKNSTVPVVIHLYKDVFPSCVKLNYALQQLAIKYPTIKFLKIVSTEAKADYDDVALPTLLVYKGGDLFKSFVKITQDLGSQDFDQDDVENLLIKEGVITHGDLSFASNPNPDYGM